jgi:hypothetical protein
MRYAGISGLIARSVRNSCIPRSCQAISNTEPMRKRTWYSSSSARSAGSALKSHQSGSGHAWAASSSSEVALCSGHDANSSYAPKPCSTFCRWQPQMSSVVPSSLRLRHIRFGVERSSALHHSTDVRGCEEVDRNAIRLLVTQCRQNALA